MAGAAPAIAGGFVDWSARSHDQRRVGRGADTVALGSVPGRSRRAAPAGGGWASSGVRRTERRRCRGVPGWAPLLGAGHPSFEPGAQMNHGSPRRCAGDVSANDVTAMVERCGHQGSPLREGEARERRGREVTGTGADACVVCPWHGSTFRLRDGYVLHGPAGGDQPTLRTQVRDGLLSLAAPRTRFRRSRRCGVGHGGPIWSPGNERVMFCKPAGKRARQAERTDHAKPVREVSYRPSC